MNQLSDIELADRSSRRRARILPALALVFVAGQPLYFSHMGMRAAEVQAVAWLGWALALLAALAVATGGGRGAGIRALVEDEVAQANRLRGYAAGFWAAMLTAIGLYAFSLFDNLKGRESVHFIVTFGLAAALIRFGLLERRALADG